MRRMLTGFASCTAPAATFVEQRVRTDRRRARRRRTRRRRPRRRRRPFDEAAEAVEIGRLDLILRRRLGARRAPPAAGEQRPRARSRSRSRRQAGYRRHVSDGVDAAADARLARRRRGRTRRGAAAADSGRRPRPSTPGAAASCRRASAGDIAGTSLRREPAREAIGVIEFAAVPGSVSEARTKP